jgi:eukaryotic-like serine/threonine-protein kinase
MDSVPNSQVKADAQDSIIPNLKSALGMDYTQLRNLVAISEWKKADEETARVMLTLRGREKEGWPDKRSIDYFPCEDLRIIDRLWVNYSDGRFGFSVQKGIYQSLGGTEKYDEKILQAFGDRVGWRKEENWLYYSNLIFSPKAPIAHLPSPPVSFIDIFDPFVLQIAKGIFSRVGVCQV